MHTLSPNPSDLRPFQHHRTPNIITTSLTHHDIQKLPTTPSDKTSNITSYTAFYTTFHIAFLLRHTENFLRHRIRPHIHHLSAQPLHPRLPHAPALSQIPAHQRLRHRHATIMRWYSLGAVHLLPAHHAALLPVLPWHREEQLGHGAQQALYKGVRQHNCERGGQFCGASCGHGGHCVVGDTEV
jgi:hypothetical protein